MDNLHNNFIPNIDTSWIGDAREYTIEEPTETTEREGGLIRFLDNFFRYSEKAAGVYQTVKSGRPAPSAGYDIQLGVPQEKKVLGMSPITGYIVIATVIGLVGYGIYVSTTKKGNNVKTKK